MVRAIRCRPAGSDRAYIGFERIDAGRKRGDLPLRVELSAQFRDLTARGIKIGAECRQCLVMLNHAVADGLRERLQDAVRTAHDRAPQSRAWVTAFEQWGSAATLRSVVAGERIAFAIGRDFGGHD